jgi:hypothetical protein
MTPQNFTIALCTVYLAAVAAACSGSDPGAGDEESPSFAVQGADVTPGDGHTPSSSDPGAPGDATSATDVGAAGPDELPCVPACEDKTCGDDGCAGTCGTCHADLVCNETGQCACEPSCDGKLCGADGCGATCGTCLAGTTCDDSGHCVCVPDCSDLDCGSDGCGGSCGACTDVQICSGTGSCVPDPSAGCAGLGLAESWSGSFSGEYAASILGIPAADGDTAGDLSFELECLPSKILLTGEIVGLASGKNDFVLTLTGTYNLDTGEMVGLIPVGSLSMADTGVIIELTGELPGSMQPDGTLSGTYSVSATAASSPFGPIDISDVDATSDGDWTASPAP